MYHETRPSNGARLYFQKLFGILTWMLDIVVHQTASYASDLPYRSSFSIRALIATITVLNDISIAHTAGLSMMPAE